MHKGVLAALVAVATVLGAEGVFRALEGRLGVDAKAIEALRDFTVHGSRLYRPYPYVNFVAAPPEKGADDHPRDWAFDLRPHDEAPRVACLGGSTTWGVYPLHLDRFLEAALGGPVEVMNWGVPGWTSQETLVNYFTNVQDYEPDVVVILHAINDTNARFFPGYRSDLAHWRTPWTQPRIGALERFLVRWSDLFAYRFLRHGNFQDLDTFTVRHEQGRVKDALTNGSERGFERNVRTIAEHVRLRGGRVVLVTQPYNLALLRDKPVAPAIEQHNQILRDLAAREGYLLVEVERTWRDQQESTPDMFTDHIHLSAEWQQREARLIADRILAEGLLESWRTRPAR